METITGSRLNHGVCRACLAQGVENFLSLGESIYQQVTIADILMTCVPQLRVELGSDELPEQICADCFHKLKTAYQFQQLCLESDKRLRAELSSVEPAICDTTINRQPSTDDLLMNEAIALTESDAKAVPMDVKDLLLVSLQSCEENKMVYETEEVDSMVMDIKIEEEEIANSNEIEFAADPLTLHGTHLKESKTNVENAANSISSDKRFPTEKIDPKMYKKKFKTGNFNDAHSRSTPIKMSKMSDENVSPNPSSNEEMLIMLEQMQLQMQMQISKQDEILANLAALETRIAKIANEMVNKSEMMAQSKLLCECKVSLKKIEASVCRMTGEVHDNTLEDIASTLPFTSVAAVVDVEEKLKTTEYAQGMTTYLHKLKGVSEDVDAVMRKVFIDKVMFEFNWDGRWGKRSLAKLVLVEHILSDVFQKLGVNRFQKEVKKSVDLSHNRFKQKRHHAAKTNPPSQ